MGYNVRGKFSTLTYISHMRLVADQNRTFRTDGPHRILVVATSLTTLVSELADLSYKHERISRKPSDLSKLARIVGCLVRLQLSPDMELLR